MPTAVVHHARVAWDFAQRTVAAADDTDDRFRWFQAELGAILGPDTERELAGTRRRLADEIRPDIKSVEIGRWRVRIEDALGGRPDLADHLRAIMRQA